MLLITVAAVLIGAPLLAGAEPSNAPLVLDV
jgi:hypothetical protein